MVDTCIFLGRLNLNNQSNILFYYMSPCTFVMKTVTEVSFFDLSEKWQSDLYFVEQSTEYCMLSTWCMTPESLLFSWAIRWSCLKSMQCLTRTMVYNAILYSISILSNEAVEKSNKWYISLIRDKSDVIYWSCKVYDKERKRGKCSFTVENWPPPPSLRWGCVSLLVCCSSLQYSH